MVADPNHISHRLGSRIRKPMRTDRAKSIERIIRQTWSSLESHLRWTSRHSAEGKNFHKKCVKEYVDIIQEVVKLY